MIKNFKETSSPLFFGRVLVSFPVVFICLVMALGMVSFAGHPIGVFSCLGLNKLKVRQIVRYIGEACTSLYQKQFRVRCKTTDCVSSREEAHFSRMKKVVAYSIVIFRLCYFCFQDIENRNFSYITTSRSPKLGKCQKITKS